MKKKEEDRRKKYDLTQMHLQQLVSSYVENELTDEEFIKEILIEAGTPIIKISEVEFIVSEWGGNLYLSSRQEFRNGCRDNWVQVEDLTDFTVGEYNSLVTELKQVYPDYPIQYLKGSFV